MYKDRINEYFESHRHEIIHNIGRLISVRSVKGEALEGMPFGSGPAEALKLALEISGGLGFICKNYENYVGTVDINDRDTSLGILAHLDVVAEGTNWTFEPYKGTLKDGKLYGRGAGDDKGPAVAALYAMAAVKDLGIELRSNVRLILGTDEESGSQDIKYYFSKESPPPCVFSPDGEFPLINTEKGSIGTSFEAVYAESVQLPRIISARGGYRSNVVPPDAEALIEGIRAGEVEKYCAGASQATGVGFCVSEEGGGKIKISAEGTGAHASTPEKGKNAVAALLLLLSSMPFSECEGFNAIKALNGIFPYGDYYGEAAGINMSDEISGELTLSLNILEYTSEKLYGYFDSRVPLCATEENTLEVLRRRLSEAGIKLENRGFSGAHHTPEDSPFVKTLLSAYEKYTGKEGYCMHSGGGTYVHDIDGGVCFGCTMPGIDTSIHGADEFAVVEDLITSAKIFAQVIIDMCR